MKKYKDDDYQSRYLYLYALWLDRLKTMAQSAIKWTGTDFYEEYFVPEKFLVDYGICLAAHDEVLGFYILPCVGSKSLNAIGMPSRYRANSLNGWVSEELTPNENCVIIMNNSLMLPDNMMISNFAERLTNIQITQTINLNSNKTPVGLRVNRDQLLTATNKFNQISMGKPVIFENDELEQVKFEAIMPQIPFLVPELSLEMRGVWAEWLTYLGIPSMDITKRERMLKDEIAQVLGGAMAARSARLMQRKQAAEKINKLFDKNITVDYDVDFQPLPEWLSGDDKEEIEDTLDVIQD